MLLELSRSPHDGFSFFPPLFLSNHVHRNEIALKIDAFSFLRVRILQKRRFAYCLRYRLVQPRTRAIVTRIVFFTSSTDEPLVVTFAKTRILYYNCGGWELTKNIDVRVKI